MSVPFPVTRSSPHGNVGSGVCRILVTDHALRHIDYVGLPQCDEPWYVDVRLMHNRDSVATLLSALNLRWGNSIVYISCYGLRGSIAGASFGLAAFCALCGVHTDVAVTGYIQSFGYMGAAMTIYEVDNVDAKIKWCMENNQPLIVPAMTHDSDILHELMATDMVTTFAQMYKVRGPDVYLIGAATSVADLAFVLSAMDNSIPLTTLMPPHIRA
jgi:hypothetical protein